MTPCFTLASVAYRSPAMYFLRCSKIWKSLHPLQPTRFVAGYGAYGWDVVYHPSCRDLAVPNDFSLFGPINKHMADKIFARDADMKQTDTPPQARHLTPISSTQVYRPWKPWWDKYLHVNDDYVEARYVTPAVPCVSYTSNFSTSKYIKFLNIEILVALFIETALCNDCIRRHFGWNARSQPNTLRAQHNVTVLPLFVVRCIVGMYVLHLWQEVNPWYACFLCVSNKFLKNYSVFMKLNNDA